MQRTLLLASLFSIAACTATVTAQAQPSRPAPPPPAAADKHPAYLHALADLRAARAQLQRPAGIVVKWDENAAIREIDASIHEIKQAAIDDGKDVTDHPPLDRPTWGGRLQRSIELLDQARNDISGEEDNPSNQIHKIRMYSLEHIANARRMVVDGQRDAATLREEAPPPVPPPAATTAHPAYLHAMSDLRFARALLERPARPDVKWDENRAVSEIDGALREIREAAIDDGKPVNEHPPIDGSWGHRDRLRKAMELLHSAAADIDTREDDHFARGLRRRANGHIRAAEQAIREAVEERHR
ncbi:MAG TPA: hypothetical protein VGM88_14885 [Kofleriaceae bacterium]|jgi:hypothetical protein